MEQTGYLEFREVELNQEGQPAYLMSYLDEGRTDFYDIAEPGPRIFVDNDGTPMVILTKDDQGALQYMDNENNPITVGKARDLIAGIMEELVPLPPALTSPSS